MIFLLELPLLLTTLPGNTRVWPIHVAAYLAGCFLLERYTWSVRPRPSLTLKMFLIALPTAVILGKSYVYRPHITGITDLFANSLGLSSEQIVPLLARVLGCLTVVSLLVLMGLVKSALAGPGEEPPEPLPAAAENSYGPRAGKSVICFCALLSLAVSAAFFTTFPLSGRLPASDSSVFLYIGKGMLEGRIPYVDMFDHKGLVLYFLQCIGLLLCPPGTYFGVWLIELLHHLAFTLLLYTLTGLISKEKPVRCLTVITVAVICGAPVYGIGNFPEEYTLPWITFALYVFLKYFVSGNYKKKEIFFLGFGCGIVVFLKANMIAPWLCLIPLTLLMLLVRKQAREILPCIGLFSLGFAAVCAPVLAYTLATGSLGEMLHYYIFFNMEYSAVAGNLINIVHAMLFFLYLFPVGFYAMTVSVFFRVGDSPRVRLLHFANLLAFFVSLVFSAMSGWGSPHYAIFLLPLLAVPICNGIQLLWNAGVKMYRAVHGASASFRWTGAVKRAVYLLLCLAFLLSSVSGLKTGASYQPSDIARYLTSHTEPDDDVLIICSGAVYYLESGRTSENKFFFQLPPANMSDKLYGEFLEEFEKKPSDVVLFYDGRQAFLDSWLTNMGDFIQRMEQRREAGEYVCEDFVDYCVYTRIK